MTDLAPAQGSPPSAPPLPRQRTGPARAGSPVTTGAAGTTSTTGTTVTTASRDRRAAVLRSVARTPASAVAATTGVLHAALVLALGLSPLTVLVWFVALLLVRASGAAHAGRWPVRGALRVGACALATGAVAAFFLPLALTRTDLAAGTALATCVAASVGAVPRLARRALGTTGTGTVLVGSAAQVHRAVSELSRRGGERLAVTGICLTDPDEDPSRLVASVAAAFPELEVTHGLARVGPAVSVLEAGAVVALAGPTLGADELLDLPAQPTQLGATLFVDSGLVDTAPARTRVTRAGSARLVKVRSSAPAPVRRLVKEVCERTFAALLLLALVPVVAVLVLLVRADREGPAVFRQVRVGRDGREFVLLKLRTMRRDAEERLADMTDLNDADQVLFKMRHDPRVTRVGRVLRRYSLDELPQLWNVVRGEMALVGPRPALPDEVAAYPPDVHRRLAVKPGLTGLWQVSGRSDLSWEESKRIDLRYVDNWSLALDLAIVLRTAGAVIGHRGAY